MIQGVRRTHGQPTEEPRGNHGELFRAILRFAEHLRENHGGTTENPFGDHTINDFCTVREKKNDEKGLFLFYIIAMGRAVVGEEGGVPSGWVGGVRNNSFPRLRFIYRFFFSKGEGQGLLSYQKKL